MALPKIGMVGVGFMGLGIATNVHKHGYDLTLLDHEGNQPVEALIGQGAKLVQETAQLAERCDIIILCVTGSPQVEAVLDGPKGLLKSLKTKTLIIDCSTAIPSSTLKMAKKVQIAGGRFIDAPMTRTPKEAMEGKLNLIVGAAKADFEEALPLLQSFAENIVHVGGVSLGHTMKLLHNYVSLGYSAIMAEAAATAAKAGVDPAVFVEVLSKGGGGGVVLDRLKPFILAGDPSGLKFSISNAHKDIGYYNAMARELNAETHTADGVFNLLNEAVGNGHGNEFLPSLIELLQQK